MKLTVIAVGSKMPAWVTQGYEEYARRLPKELTPQLVELPLATRSKTVNTSKVKHSEGEQILAAAPKNARLVCLDVFGKSLSTEHLAEKMSRWQMEATDVCLVIGGPDGLSPQCLAAADERWSLSALTLPHPLVRIVLIEQLYRAWTILQNHPYHK